MKKIILGVTALVLTVTLSACGASANSVAITDLSNQLNETANTISSIKVVNPNDISLTTTQLDKMLSASDVTQNSQKARQSLLNEEYYKTDILQKTSQLKTNLSENLKLSKAQIGAIKDLTSNLAKYTNSVSYTENEMSTTAKSILSMQKDVSKNEEKIKAKLNRLACNSNTRSAYYENILNTLDQIESCLNLSKTDSNTTQNVTENTASSTSEKTTKSKKNIDTYLTNDKDNSENEDDNLDYDNIPSPTASPNQTYTNTPHQTMPTNPDIYNRYARFNSGRNTDTYGPMARNIDTYGINNGFGYFQNGNTTNGIYGNPSYNNRFYGNQYFPNSNPTPYNTYNSNNANRLTNPYIMQSQPVSADNDSKDDTKQSQSAPEQRLEDYEKLNSDNTVEKLKENSAKTQKTNNETKLVSLTHLDNKLTKHHSAKNTQHSSDNFDSDDLNKTVHTC